MRMLLLALRNLLRNRRRSAMTLFGQCSRAFGYFSA